MRTFWHRADVFVELGDGVKRLRNRNVRRTLSADDPYICAFEGDFCDGLNVNICMTSAKKWDRIWGIVLIYTATQTSKVHGLTNNTHQCAPSFSFGSTVGFMLPSAQSQTRLNSYLLLVSWEGVQHWTESSGNEFDQILKRYSTEQKTITPVYTKLGYAHPWVRS